MKLANTKKFLSGALAAALACGMLAGCGAQKAPAESKPAESTPAASESVAPAEEEVTVRVAWWGNQVRNEGTMAMLDAYTEEHPNVKFEAEFSDWTGYWDKLATQAASNNMPDVIQHAYMYLAQYVENNQLLELTEQIEKGNLNVDYIADSVLATGEFNGGLYGICNSLNSTCMIINEDVLKEAGVTISEHPTFEEINEVGKTVFDKTGVRTDIFGGDLAMTILAREFNQNLYKQDGVGLGMDKDTILKYFQHQKDSIEAPHSITIDQLQESVTAGMEGCPVATSKTWNGYFHSNQLQALQNANKDKLSMVMSPRTEGAEAEGMYLKPGQHWVIPSSTQHPDEAARVIDYYTNSEKAQDCLMAERGVPVSSKMREYLAPKLDPMIASTFEYVDMVTKVAPPIDKAEPLGSSELVKLIGDITDLVRFGELTPEEATERFFAEGNKILEKAAK